MEKLVSWLCSVPLGDSIQQANPLSSNYWSPVCQQLHPSCNQHSQYPFWTPSWWTPVVIRLVVNSLTEVIHDDWQTVETGIVSPCWVQEPPCNEYNPGCFHYPGNILKINAIRIICLRNRNSLTQTTKLHIYSLEKLKRHPHSSLSTYIICWRRGWNSRS